MTKTLSHFTGLRGAIPIEKLDVARIVAFRDSRPKMAARTQRKEIECLCDLAAPGMSSV